MPFLSRKGQCIALICKLIKKCIGSRAVNESSLQQTARKKRVLLGIFALRVLSNEMYIRFRTFRVSCHVHVHLSFLSNFIIAL